MVKNEKKDQISEKMGLELSRSPSDPFDYFIDYFKKKTPRNNLLKESENYNHLFRLAQEQEKKYKEDISQKTLISAFLTWIKYVRTIENDFFDPQNLNFLKIIVDEGSIPFEKNGEMLTLSQINTADLTFPLEKIRSSPNLSIAVKEACVRIYLLFLRWLSLSTLEYIPSIEDPDKAKIQGRVISRDQFTKLILNLDEKGQLVAKLLYFGGSRTLEEVLSLKLEDVNFKQSLIRYGTQLVSYPAHVFSDIKVLTTPRKTGRIFLGRQNAPLNRVTIFRSFKEAGSLAGLGTDFSPKGLTTSS